MKDRSKAYVGGILILVAIGLGVWQWSVNQAFSLQVNVLNTQANNLTVEETQITERFQSLKAEVATDRESISQQIELVFPADESLTDVTRLFDDFEVKNNFSSNPFFISNISYLSTVEQDNYRVLPFSVKLTASKKNLLKFLEFIETSGSLESEVRLMSIEDFSISYPQEYGGAYEVSASILTYFSRDI